MRTRVRRLAVLIFGILTLLGLFARPAGAGDGDDFNIKVQVKDQVTDDAGKNTRVPVAGVTVVISSADGTELGRVVTDDAGIATLAVGLRADYTVTLDESTLPEGLGLRASTPAARSVKGDDFKTSTLTINYFTGEANRAEKSFVEKFAQRFVDGARFGLVIAMCSVGLSLIFGTTGLTNFAHGEMVTFGGMIAFLFNVSWGIPLLVAAPIVLVAGGLFGLLLDRAVFGPLRRRGIGLISQLVVSVGLAILLKNFFLYRFGGRVKPLADYNSQTDVTFGPIGITPRDLIAALLSIVVLVAVALALQRTRIGKATRAVSDNPDLASSTGIDSQRIIRIVWFVGGALAAFGGITRGLDEGISPEMGADLLFLMFAGITLGGLGSAFGALVGGFIVGLFIELSTLFGMPTELKKVPALVVLVLILLVRPQGILGRRERVG